MSLVKALWPILSRRSDLEIWVYDLEDRGSLAHDGLGERTEKSYWEWIAIVRHSKDIFRQRLLLLWGEILLIGSFIRDRRLPISPTP
jgi:hypothetical protein